MNGFIVRGASAAAGITLLAVGGALPAAAQPAGGRTAGVTRTWLNGVAASSRRAAFAVGYAGNGALAIRWNGSSWRRVPSPSPSQNAIFNGVAALSARRAWAVGCWSRGMGSSQLLIERWNGRNWRPMRVPNVRGGGDLFGVTATSARDVWAVGESGDPNVGSTRTLIMHWNGIVWKRVPSPGNAPGVFVELLSVAAASARDAWAVGDSGLADKTLALHWNGTSWTRVPSPSMPGGAVLNGVAATSGAVWAVGTGGGFPYQTFILRWKGNHWVRVPSPSPSADGGSQLYSVAITGKTGPGRSEKRHSCLRAPGVGRRREQRQDPDRVLERDSMATASQLTLPGSIDRRSWRGTEGDRLLVLAPRDGGKWCS